MPATVRARVLRWKNVFKASWKIPFECLTVAIMNVAITSSSSVEEVVEFLEGKGLGEITDKLTGKRPLFSSSVIQFISDYRLVFAGMP